MSFDSSKQSQNQSIKENCPQNPTQSFKNVNCRTDCVETFMFKIANGYLNDLNEYSDVVDASYEVIETESQRDSEEDSEDDDEFPDILQEEEVWFTAKPIDLGDSIIRADDSESGRIEVHRIHSNSENEKHQPAVPSSEKIYFPNLTHSVVEKPQNNSKIARVSINVICKNCEKKIYQTFVEKHYELCPGNKSNQCTFQNCNCTFTSNFMRCRHEIATHKPTLQCPYEKCDRFLKLHRLHLHIKQYHANKCIAKDQIAHYTSEPDDQVKKFVCLYKKCGVFFDTKEMRANHMMRMHGILIKCPYPNCDSLIKLLQLAHHIVEQHHEICQKWLTILSIQDHKKYCTRVCEEKVPENSDELNCSKVDNQPEFSVTLQDEEFWFTTKLLDSEEVITRNNEGNEPTLSPGQNRIRQPLRTYSKLAPKPNSPKFSEQLTDHLLERPETLDLQMVSEKTSTPADVMGASNKSLQNSKHNGTLRQESTSKEQIPVEQSLNACQKSQATTFKVNIVNMATGKVETREINLDTKSSKYLKKLMSCNTAKQCRETSKDDLTSTNVVKKVNVSSSRNHSDAVRGESMLNVRQSMKNWLIQSRKFNETQPQKVTSRNIITEPSHTVLNNNFQKSFEEIVPDKATPVLQANEQHPLLMSNETTGLQNLTDKSTKRPQNNLQVYRLKRNVPCKFCIKFFSQDSIDVHMKRCLRKKGKLYRCTVEGCASTFTSNDNRRRHEVSVHMPPIKCPYKNCEKLIKLGGFDCHIKLYHSNKEMIGEANEVQFRFATDVPVDRRMPCPYEKCDAEFDDKNNWADHIRRRHTTPFVRCPFDDCNSLVKLAILSRHVRKEHQKL